MNNSGLHLGFLSRRKRCINPWLFHPLKESTFIVLNKWSWTWFQHTRAPWMSASGVGSVTALIRRARENAMLYPYPKPHQIPFYANSPC